jgi:TonB family protein
MEVVMLGALILSLALPLSPQSQPPRDRTVAARPVAAEPAAREAELAKRIAQTPNGVAAYVELSKLQEDRGAYPEAEATLMRGRQANPKDKKIVMALSGFYNRQGDFEKTIAALEAAEQLDPTDPTAAQIVATYYWEKAFRDHQLLPADQLRYVMSGIAATDRALALKADYVDALTYKNLLLRLRSQLETDPVLKQQLVAEADALRNRAIELNKQRTAINGGNDGVALGPVPPPPPPPPPVADGAAESASGMAPVRVGGNIRTPTKIRDVRPAYPPEAQAAGIQGVVIIEATIDVEGHVGDAKVLRSIPQLDEPALTAVRQWEFTPTKVNGVPVPVVMTVTVNFSLQ